MNFLVCGLNHQSAPLHIRERLDFSKQDKRKYLKRLTQCDSIHAGMVVSTCNRVEVYASGTYTDQLIQDTKKFLLDFHATPATEVDPFLYFKLNREAVRHLFRVAASLDSMVVGEPQILGQVKEAYFDASGLSCIDAFFDRLLQKTFSVAKRIRRETSISEHAISVSYVAVKLAGNIFSTLENKKVMILGAGEMAELTAKHLQNQKTGEIFFANRSFQHSAELAGEYRGIPIHLDDFEKYLLNVDILVVSTGAPHYLIKPAQIERVMKERKQAPIFIIDISVPRNVDPLVHELSEVYLYNIDDLKTVASLNQEARAKEAKKAEKIVEVEVERFYENISKLEASPIIQSLQSKYEKVREEEMSRLEKRLKNTSSPDLSLIHRTTSSLVRKILNDPILYLTQSSSSLDRYKQVELFSKIFDLKEKPKSNLKEDFEPDEDD